KFQLTEQNAQLTKTSSKKITNIFSTGRKASLALMMPLIIIFGIYSGIFTATEAAVVSVIYAVIVGFLFHRDLTFKDFYNSSLNTALTSAFILGTLIFATIF